MKKILLTSALILSIAGLAPASVLGEENTTQSTPAVKEAIAKEEKKESTGIWKSINELNLVHNVLPTRARAHLILQKGANHSVQRVFLRKN